MFEVFKITEQSVGGGEEHEGGQSFIDVTEYDIGTPKRQKGKVFPYQFYSAFNSLRVERGELEKPCPKCGREDTIHLGSFLSSDIWHNVYGCGECGIAWCVSEQTGKIVKKPEIMENLVKTLYDSDFTPDDERKNRCENCASFQPEEVINGQCRCEIGRITSPTNSCEKFTSKNDG